MGNAAFSAQLWRRASQHRGRQGFISLTGWRWETLLSGLALALIAGALRLDLILRYPLLYDGDAYGRWLNRTSPFDSPWVPLFQLCLYLLTRLADSILAIRLLSAFFGVTAVLAFWLLLCRAFDPVIAYLGALAFALDPLFVVFSIVPYQEGLFLTLACLALWLALEQDEPRWVWLALVIGLAALTRYEGWLLALLLWLLLLRRRRHAGTLHWRFVIGSALALAWAPLLWIAALRNISPDGLQTLSPTLDPLSLLTTLRTLWPGWSLNLGLGGGILIMGGFFWLGWRAWHGSNLAGLLVAFLIGDVLLIAFLRPFSPGNLRLPLLSLPVVLTGVCGLLVEGTRFLWQRLSPKPFWVARQRLLSGSPLMLMTVLMLLWLAPMGVSRVAAYDTLVRPAYLAAEAAARLLIRGAAIAQTGPDSDVAAFEVYAQQAGVDDPIIDLAPDVVDTPATLSAALCQAHAQLLIAYGTTATSAGTLALARSGTLLQVGNGPGYTFYFVQSSLQTGTCSLAGVSTRKGDQAICSATVSHTYAKLRSHDY